MATTVTPPLRLQMYSDAPEVVPDHDSGLETVVHSTLEAAEQQHSTLEPHPASHDTSPELWKPPGGETPTPGSPTENTPALESRGGQLFVGILKNSSRRRRRRFGLCSIAAVLAIIGVILGCVLGLRSKSAVSDGDGTAGNQTSVCRNTVCPQVIAVPENYARGRLAIFARGADNLIYFRYAPNSSASTDGWQSMPGVEFQGQPSAAAWNNGQVQVTAISSDTSTGNRAARGNVFTTWIRPDAPDAAFQPWFNLGETAAGAAPMCVVPRDVWINSYTDEARDNITVADRLDVWAFSTESKNVVHDFWEPDYNVWMSPETTTAWDTSCGSDAPVGSLPAVTCRDSVMQHDLLVYTPQGTARWHAYSNKTGNWSDWAEIPGVRFAGDPVTVAVGGDRWDFFGVEAESNVLQHASWTQKTGFLSELEAVGGVQLESVPSVVVTGADMGMDPRMDVVGLASDDRIVHQSLVGGTWNEGWEVVGEFGNSAPAVARFKCDDGADCTAILVLGRHSRMRYTFWPTMSSRTWNSTAQWLELGGNFSTGYMQVS